MRVYQQLKNIYHFVQAHAWRIMYARPDQGLVIYGITGTNGKTTTCHLLASILSDCVGAEKVGMLTTISVRTGKKTDVNETKLTTLPSRLVYKYLKRMKLAGVTHVVMEMTSHALDQNRLAGIRLAGAIVTHIEREHLNYHRTMEEYVAAKAKIAQYLVPDAPLVTKKNNEWARKLVDMGRQVNPNIKVVWFTSEEAKQVHTGLPGEVNRENALAAAKLARAESVLEECIQAGLLAVTSVPGRMEEVANSRGIRIVIDYAVTPQALEKLYQDIRANTQGRVLAILGAAGLRDRGKRADMARAVAKYAHELIITREDPWTENEEQIFSDLEQGLTHPTPPVSGGAPDVPPDKGDTGGFVWRRIVDRKQALQFLLQQARPGDVVVATGKGAETGMGMGKNIVPYNERQTIEEILASL